jgi:hypothetical protein
MQHKKQMVGQSAMADQRLHRLHGPVESPREFPPKWNFSPMEGAVAQPAQITSNSTIVASPENLATELGDEIVLLNMKRGAYHGLEGVGPRIWELIQQPRLVSEIHQTLVAEYDVAPEECERDLMEVLREMSERGLIEIKPPTR